MTIDNASDDATASRSERITVTMDEDLAARLATFRRRHRDVADRDEDAIRHILRQWLTENGYYGLHEEDGTRPEALNASNDD